MKVSASLVLFNNSPEQLQRLLQSIAKSSTTIHLIVIDNSPSPTLAELFNQYDYRHSGQNIGFGAAHNIAIACVQSHIHLILNPDIEFGTEAVTNLIAPFQNELDIVACSPQIRYPDGSLQRLNKLLPTPANLFTRRFIPFFAKWLDYNYEMQWFGYDKRIDLPNASGCFLAVRTSILKNIGGFDERFFMYMEDTDLVRRLRKSGRVSFIPEALVIHEFGKASYKNPKLMWIHITSAVRYFNKWGWLFDPEREKLNQLAMKEKHKLNPHLSRHS